MTAASKIGLGLVVVGLLLIVGFGMTALGRFRWDCPRCIQGR